MTTPTPCSGGMTHQVPSEAELSDVVGLCCARRRIGGSTCFRAWLTSGVRWRGNATVRKLARPRPRSHTHDKTRVCFADAPAGAAGGLFATILDGDHSLGTAAAGLRQGNAAAGAGAGACPRYHVEPALQPPVLFVPAQRFDLAGGGGRGRWGSEINVHIRPDPSDLDLPQAWSLIDCRRPAA